jgi:hypothetical protein
MALLFPPEPEFFFSMNQKLDFLYEKLVFVFLQNLPFQTARSD